MKNYWLAGLLAAAAWSAPPKDNLDAYGAMQKAKSYYDLIQQNKLVTYSARVDISGPLFDEIVAMAGSQNLTNPQFEEYYRAPNQIVFRVINLDYPAPVRQMITSMFSPTAVFTKIIDNLENKHSLSWYNDFKDASAGHLMRDIYQGTEHYLLMFRSKPGKHIDFSEENLGVLQKRKWADSLSMIVLPDEWLVREIHFWNHEVVISKENGKETHSYSQSVLNLNYEKIGNRLFPSQLTIGSGDSIKVSFTAKYQKVKGFILFSEKVFSYRSPKNPGKIEQVTISYKDYLLNPKLSDDIFTVGNMQMKNKDAIELHQKAQNALMAGNTDEAKKHLRKLVENFPGTEEAEQAKVMLEGLP